MAKIISIHSYRGGTGKSNTTANLVTLLAQRGLRVGVVDTDIQSPGINTLFGLEQSDMKNSLNDYLWGQCSISDAAYDVTGNLKTPVDGKVFLIPSSLNAGEIARVLREGYDVGLLDSGFQELIKKLELDALLIDTHPGLNEETLLSIAISDIVLLILRPDQQDYLGTSVTVEVARKLEVAELLMAVNKVPAVFDFEEVKATIGKTYNTEVAALMPHADELMVLASAGIFALEYPDHPVTQELQKLADRLLA
ncbi:MAG: MinD/ParA family protein [Chloroflexi bacterium]|nr:MAG: MinD/ParA family protein [Chloroflexota bacterium]MBL1195416.1 MinD/ParA family protein [Chloroflexota bacterium]NOH12699.1 MinD/ParA family protein [Chloroflexota bacterium]